MKHKAIFWFRRDLRLFDNVGLFEALKSGMEVIPVFVFDTHILGKLENKADRRVHFIHHQLVLLANQLRDRGKALRVYHGKPELIFQEIIRSEQVDAIYCNADYEPAARLRDAQVQALAEDAGVKFYTFTDQVLFDSILKADAKPYTVFTPYANQWRARLAALGDVPRWPSELHLDALSSEVQMDIPSLQHLGFEDTDLVIPSTVPAAELLLNYAAQRDFPAQDATTRLSVHLRFGTVSIRELIILAQQHSAVWLNELIWREFYKSILWHYPRVESTAFKPQYEHLAWRNNESEFEAWCAGKTGYPIVDAGMRELNQTGFMHNRVRMITASFLVKHLLIDWRWGEAYFADKLLDFDLSANNGSWQWAASTGCDAVPYFRIFNPYLQTKRFDPQAEYIRRWLPEFDSLAYPPPIVEHDFARKRALAAYALVAKNKHSI